MFFSIRQHKDNRFPRHYRVRGWWINTDLGWKHTTHNGSTIIYKGYMDEHVLDHTVGKVAEGLMQEVLGNFCAIVIDDGGVRLHHSRYREFNLWFEEGHGLENLEEGSRVISADSRVRLDNDLAITITHEPIIGQWKDLPTLSRDRVISNVIELLDHKFSSFADNNDTGNIYAFLSGGIDTTTLWLMLKRHGIKHTLLLNQHVDFGWFWLTNRTTLRKYPAYKIVHQFRDPSTILVGRPGDEFSLRANSSIVNLLMMRFGIDLPELLSNSSPADMANHAFLEQYRDKIAQEQRNPLLQKIVKDRDFFNRHILERCSNDHQSWHIDNNIHWTPFRDLDILRNYLCLNMDDQKDQALNNGVSVDIIKKLDPSATTLLSQQKNHNNLSVLTRFFNDVPLEIDLND